MKSIRPYLPAIACLLALAAAGLVACAPTEEPVEEEPIEESVVTEEPVAAPLVAHAMLHPPGDEALTGHATFTEEDGSVTLHVTVEGAPAGTHGFHVHETGACDAPDFTSSGGHFNPGGVDHACPPDTPRHAGDFGNIEVDEDGTGTLDVTVSTDLVTVAEGPNSLAGRAVILHGGADDCASQPTGDAGSRLACGLIEVGGQNGMGGMDESMDEGDDEGAGEQDEAN